MKTALQLRCLLENDLERVRHYAALLQGDDQVIDATSAADPVRSALLTKFAGAVRQAQLRRAQLQSISGPNGGPSNTPAALQLGQVGEVTSDAAQPAILD